MGFILEPLQEADLDNFTRSEFEAFRPHPRTPIMWPRGYTDDFWAFNVRKKLQSFHSPTSKFFQLIDTDRPEGEQLVAGAQWTVCFEPDQYGPEESMCEDENPPDDWPQDGNWAVRRWFLINSQKLMNQHVCGKPYITLENLTVSPAYHGQGLGSQLLRWGVHEADRRAVRICLESTPAGLSLYKKFGFVEIETIKCDMRALGVTADYDDEAARRVFMIREPGSVV